MTNSGVLILTPDGCLDFRFRLLESLRIGRSTKNKRAATSSPRHRPGSQSLGIARRAKCPPTSTARFRRVRSALVLVNVLYTDAPKHSSPDLPDHSCCPCSIMIKLEQ